MWSSKHRIKVFGFIRAGALECKGLVMEDGANSLIPGLLDSIVASFVLPKIESSKLKCEVAYTLGSLLLLNKAWSTFIQSRSKYIEMLEEWWEGERRWAQQHFYDTMPEEAFSD